MEETSIISVFTYVFLWIIAFIVAYRKNRKQWCASNIIIASYFIYSCVAVALFFDRVMGYRDETITLFPFLYLFGMLLLGMWPVLHYDKTHYKSIAPPSRIVFNGYLYFYIILVLVRVPGIITTLPEGINMIVLEDAGMDLYVGEINDYMASDRKISNIVAVFYSFFSDMGILLLFYYLTLPDRKKWISVVLGISIIVKALDSLAHGQRTGPTLVVLTVIMTFFLMKQYMSVKEARIIKRVILIAVIVVGIPFVYLTNSRFGDSSIEALRSVESYTGQAPLNFNMYCLDAGGIRYGDRTAPEFKRLLGFSDVPVDVNSRREKYPYLKIDDYMFYTYVGDFTLDYGPLAAVLIFFIVSLSFKNLVSTNNKENIPFYKMIAVYFAACVCMQGGMYLFTYAHLDNYKILATALSFLLFYYDYNVNLPKSDINRLTVEG